MKRIFAMDPDPAKFNHLLILLCNAVQEKFFENYS